MNERREGLEGVVHNRRQPDSHLLSSSERYPAANRHHVRAAAILALGEEVSLIRLFECLLEFLVHAVIRRIAWASGKGAYDKGAGVV